MGLEDFFSWVESWPMAEAIRTSVWMFPTIESLHVLAIVFVVGSIVEVDLRLLGVIWRDRPVTSVSAEMLPWTWTSFAVAAVTGLLLFTSHALRYYENVYYVSKMVFLVLAGLNVWYFERVTFRGVAAWDNEVRLPSNARFAAAASLILWMSIVTAGRFVGFI